MIYRHDITHLRENAKEEKAESNHMQRLEDGDHKKLVPAGLGDIFEEDDPQGLDQGHTLCHRECDVDAPMGRRMSYAFCSPGASLKHDFEDDCTLKATNPNIGDETFDVAMSPPKGTRKQL